MNIASKIKENVGKVVLGKGEIIDLLMTALISGGHVLLEDVPGVGKTTMAKALAKSISCDFKRIQFTPDLLPTDLTGINYFNQKAGEFEFRKGPLFTNILLADEINRATPRTQSSLLECMEERQITVEGDSYKLEKPFFVLATQNPIENYGTFPLPEAQLDRFLMKVKMGYPERAEEQKILDLFDKQSPIENIEAVCSSADIVNMQQQFGEVTLNKDLSAFILDIIEATRKHESIELGASPRASIALYKAAQAYAYINERKYVRPDDIIYLAPTILSHRIILKGLNTHRRTEAAALVNEIISSIPVPIEKMQ
jgi:MoxR-like ATPase